MALDFLKEGAIRTQLSHDDLLAVMRPRLFEAEQVLMFHLAEEVDFVVDERPALG